jgi:acyl carrier protein
MKMTREDVMNDVLGLLNKLADDWEYGGEITSETRFFADMGLASIDIVVLGTAVQEHYGRVLPFVELFTKVGQKRVPDLPVGEWVDFIYQHLNQSELAEARTAGGTE